MKKYLIWIVAAFFSFIPFAFGVELEINSQNAILYNLDENKVLYEKQSDEVIPIASLTKIMTAIVTVEHVTSLNEKVTINASDLKGLAEANASVAGFSIGETVTIRDLLYGLLLPSGADAAQTLTRVVANSREKFVALMNQKASEMGLVNTHFENETGLDSENHHSTVREVAAMFQYALHNEELKKILTSQRYTMSDGKFSVMSTLTKNINRYQLPLDYILGGKTGTTDHAGLCLASIAQAGGVNYMLITVRAPYDKTNPYNFYDARTIYDYFIENYEKKNVIEKEDILLTLETDYAKEEKVDFKAEDEISKLVPRTYQKEDLVVQYDGVNTIPFHTKVGTKLGTANAFYDGEFILSKDIILTNDLHLDFGKYIKGHILEIIAIFIAIAVILILCYHILKKRTKKRKK